MIMTDSAVFFGGFLAALFQQPFFNRPGLQFAEVVFALL